MSLYGVKFLYPRIIYIEILEEMSSGGLELLLKDKGLSQVTSDIR